MFETLKYILNGTEDFVLNLQRQTEFLDAIH